MVNFLNGMSWRESIHLDAATSCPAGSALVDADPALNLARTPSELRIATQLPPRPAGRHRWVLRNGGRDLRAYRSGPNLAGR